jgi:hypothetical protein
MRSQRPETVADHRYLAMGGQIIDATVVPASEQRSAHEQKAAIQEGRIPETWPLAPTRSV